MSEYQYIKVSIEDRIATLTIDRPPVNAFNSQVVNELDAAFDEVYNNDEVKAIIITGAGQLAFVAGADINEIKTEIEKAKAGEKITGELIKKGQNLFTKIEQARKPVIAAINAVCLGGGNELAMACHMRIASERARFGQPEINLGIIPGWGGNVRLPRHVGKGKAIELILTGDMISAQEAYRLGLVNKVVPAGQVMKAAKDLARKIVSKSALPAAAALEVIEHSMHVSLQEALDREAEKFLALCATDDAMEGISAFLERRQPKFQDK